jgi:hypothetical protein
MKNLSQIDNHDFQMLGIIAASGHQQISSWEICQALYPDNKNPQNHLSSVIWRLEKLVRLNFLNEHPHPTREGKKIYSLPKYAFSVDGTVFIPSPIGGIIVNCRFKKDNEGKETCQPCKFGTPECELHTAILKEGLEPVLRIAERLTKLNSNSKKEEKKTNEYVKSNSGQTSRLAAVQN